MTYPTDPDQQYPAAPPYQGQPYQQQPYPQYGQAQPGYAPPGYYGQSGGPQFLPPEASKHNARFDAVNPVRVLASPGRRLSARLIDVLVLIAVGAVAGAVPILLGRAIGGSNLRLDTAGGVVALVLLILFGLCWLLYEPLFVWKKGGTPGKLLLGIRVVRTSDARDVGFGAALGRYFFPFAMSIIPLGALLNALWLLWDRPLYQCLHDKVVGSVVVYVEGGPPQSGNV